MPCRRRCRISRSQAWRGGPALGLRLAVVLAAALATLSWRVPDAAAALALAGRQQAPQPLSGSPSGGRFGPVAPRLVIAAPPALRGVAAELRAAPPAALAEVTQLMGLTDPGPPIRVWLEAEGSPAALAVPRWIAGLARGDAGIVVLFPARAPSYPDSSLTDVLRHEVAHVLAARAAGGRPLPRWFDEGLAMIAGTSWRADDRARLLLELLVDREVPLADLDQRFAGGERRVAGAYALSGAFVRDLVGRHGAGVPGRILAAVAAGAPFADAFRAATGTTLSAAEAAFWRHHSLRRWLPLATSTTTLWLAVTLLALYAFGRRRRRDAARRRLWDDEETLSFDASRPTGAATTGEKPKAPSRRT